MDTRDPLAADNYKLACEFFVCFSRLEYALKRAGYYGLSRNFLNVDWKRFCSDFSDRFCVDSSEELRKSFDYFESFPPRNQIIRNRKLSWSKPLLKGDSTELDWLVRVVRCVRNNLFHGGKFQSEEIEEPTRNAKLISHSVVVLKCLATLSDDVERYFEIDF